MIEINWDLVLQRNPMLASRVQDLRNYGLCSNYYDELPPGIYKYLSDREQEQSDPDYKDFSYHINDIGFRGHYPDPNNERTMGFFGCSMTFGVGLPDEDIFPRKIAYSNNSECLNLGVGGASCRRVAMIFGAAARVWKMHTAVVTLPSWYRMLYVDERGHMKNIHMHGMDITDEPAQIVSRVSNDYWLAFETQDCINTIIQTAKAYHIRLILTSWDSNVRELIKRITDYEPPAFKLWDTTKFPEPGDYARDRAHPGVNLVDPYVESINYSITINNYIPLYKIK